MTKNTTPVNRHIVDQLADIRKKIRTYQALEEGIKAALVARMGEHSSLGGDEYIAIRTQSCRDGGLDIAAMERDGIVVASYRKPGRSIMSIRVVKRVGVQ